MVFNLQQKKKMLHPPLVYGNKSNVSVFGNKTTNPKDKNNQQKFCLDPLGSVWHLAAFQQMCQVKWVWGEYYTCSEDWRKLFKKINKENLKKKKKKGNFFIGAYLKHSKREILMFGPRIFVSFFTTDILLFDHYDNEIKDNLWRWQ